MKESRHLCISKTFRGKVFSGKFISLRVRTKPKLLIFSMIKFFVMFFVGCILYRNISCSSFSS